MTISSSVADLLVVNTHESCALSGPQPLLIDTAGCSPLHQCHRRRALTGSKLKLYLAAVAVTYVPMAMAAVATNASSASIVPTLPFFRDWNVAFLFLVSFPCLFVLTATDDDLLRAALHRVQADGVMVASHDASSILTDRWSHYFRVINTVAYVVGAIVGVLLVYLNYAAYVPEHVGYWIARESQLLSAGYVFLFGIFIFYALIPVFVFRTIAVSFFSGTPSHIRNFR